MSVARVGQTATLLPNGEVLIVGGRGAAGPLSSAELYDPETGRFSPTGPMNVARQGQMAVLLATGQVLIVGGEAAGGVADALASAEVYDPATGTFRAAGTMATGRDSPSATTLPGGSVLIAGGADGSAAGTGTHPVLALASAEIYRP